MSTIAREGHCGLVLILLALEFVERRVIGVVLRCLGHVALGRDLRPEIAGLYQHDMNAERARLKPQALAYAFQDEFARTIKPSERQPNDARQGAYIADVAAASGAQQR